MNRWITALFLVIVFASTGAAQTRKRVAVLDFDYSAVKTVSDAVFGTSVDVGKSITDLLVTDLVKSGVYSVIERKAIEKVLSEQNFSNSDRADSNTAAKLAKILGVDVIITGSITQFGRDDKSTGVGGGAVGSVIGGKLGIGGLKKNESKAVVNITARMINTDTAEIMAVAEGKGESTRSGTSLVGAGATSGSAAGGGINMGSSNFANTILGEATNKAVQSVADQLDQNANKMPAKAEAKVSGLVAFASPTSLVLNVGSKAGLKVGDKLEVRRGTGDIKDPTTGKVIRTMSDKIGTATVTDVDENSAGASFTGDTPAKIGDMVERIP